MCSQSAGLALKSKVLVVIGGTTGIGLSAARAFVSAGAKIVALGLDPVGVETASHELKNAARVICGDACKPDSSSLAIEEALRTFGGFDGLYHVAGGSGRRFGDGPLHELSDTAWQATLELNLTSVVYSNRAAVRQFLSRGRGGVVLNVGSVLASSPSPRLFATHAYATAKAGIEGFTRACAAHYAPHNIRFNVLAPGVTATPMSERAQKDERISAFVRNKQPLDGGRIGEPKDLDAAAIYLLSDASRFVTGQVLAVDGGWSVTEGQLPTNS
jgi:NAD(P)-dependent dehydrogenase (short-subunit alcohol dehydrogenase family)